LLILAPVPLHKIRKIKLVVTEKRLKKENKAGRIQITINFYYLMDEFG